jgi:hypothetical protein
VPYQLIQNTPQQLPLGETQHTPAGKWSGWVGRRVPPERKTKGTRKKKQETTMTTPPSKRLRVDPIEPTEKVVNVIDEEMELQRLELRIQCTGPGHERVRLIQSFQAMALPPYVHR